MSHEPEAVNGRTRAQALRWRINRLRCMRPAELPFRLARSITAHLEPIAPHRSRVPPADRAAAADRWVHVPEGLDAAPYLAAANRIVAGTLDIFGMSCAGNAPPRWNRDPKTGVEAPLVFGKRLDYRDRRRVGEVKYLWEVNRHLHLVTLAQAYALGGDAKYLETLRQHVDSWISACPYGLGPNWSSALEVAIRLINWSIAWQIAGGADGALFVGSEGGHFRQRWLGSIYQHARFVHGYFSRHSSANNHLIGEAAGLYIAGLTWPCWPELRRWRAGARRILEREALVQNSADGVNLEQAVCYQQFVLDFLLLALLAGENAGEALVADYRQRIAAMLAFLASIMDAGGRVPMIGDGDDGAVTRLAPHEDFCPYRSLLASGAVLFEDAALRHKAGELDDKTRWLFGPRAQEAFERLRGRTAVLPRRRTFPGGGYYILGCDLETADEMRVVADGEAEWNEVGRHQRRGADESVAADAAVLVHAGKAAQERVIANLDVAANGGGLRHDDVAADVAIVSDVAIAHDQAMRTDIGDRTAANRAAVKGRVFANDVVIAEHEPRRFARIGQILRRAAKQRKREDGVVGADIGVAFDEDVGDEFGALADLYVRPDDAAGTDLNVGAEFGALIDNRGGMNFCAHVRSPLVAANSQSLTNSPPTSMRPRNLKMLRRWNTTSTGISKTSPGFTGRLKRALSTAMNRMTNLLTSSSMVFDMSKAPVCAIASICKTPGMTGSPGKWPGKNGSLKVTFLMPRMEVLGT